MTPRDRRISDQLVRLIQLTFAVVLAQSFFLYRDLVLDPFSPSHALATMALATLLVTAVLSRIDWHITMELRPYNFSALNIHRVTEQFRLGLDLFIVITYAYMFFAIIDFDHDPSRSIARYLIGFPIIFAAYYLGGLARQRTHGRLASNPAPIVLAGSAYIALYFVYRVAYAGLPNHAWANAGAIVVAFAVIAGYRVGRARVVKRRQAEKKNGLVVAIDIDGVLANQITGIIPRARARLGLQFSYSDVTEWRFRLGETDIANEIALAYEDPDYILTMPVHRGAREFVDALYRKNTVVLLTARPLGTKALTMQWLENHGFTYDELLNAKEEKKSLYGADVLIDDYIGNISEFLAHGHGTALLVRQPWNHRAVHDLAEWIGSHRLHIVDDLQEARKTVLTLRATRRGAREIRDVTTAMTRGVAR